MTIFELQQSRKAAEVWRGPWQQTLAAIREAKGARNAPTSTRSKRARQTPPQLAGAPLEIAVSDGRGGWFWRLLFGAPKLEWHPSDEPGGEGYYE